MLRHLHKCEVIRTDADFAYSQLGTAYQQLRAVVPQPTGTCSIPVSRTTIAAVQRRCLPESALYPDSGTAGKRCLPSQSPSTERDHSARRPVRRPLRAVCADPLTDYQRVRHLTSRLPRRLAGGELVSARAASGTRRGLGDLDDVAGATGLVNARTNTSLNLDNIEPPSTKTNSQTQICTRFPAAHCSPISRIGPV